MDKDLIVKILGVVVSLIAAWGTKKSDKIDDKAVVPTQNFVMGQGISATAGFIPGVTPMTPLDGAQIAMASEFIYRFIRSISHIVRCYFAKGTP